MKTSLKEYLHDIVKSQGHLSYAQLETICEENDFKIDTGRRRMDDLQDVAPIYADKKRGGQYVSGWRYKGITLSPSREKIIQGKLL